MSGTEDVRLDGFERLFAKTLPDELESAQLQQIQRVRGFFFNLDRLFRNATLYHFDHSSVEGLKKRLIEELASVFELVSEFTVEIQPFEIFLFGHQVFEHQSVDNHYVFRLYQDGLRALSFRRGITEGELMELCQILVTDFASTDLFEDDLITLMWSHEWTHISIDVCEVVAEVTTQTKNYRLTMDGLIDSIAENQKRALATDRRTRFSSLDLRQTSLLRKDLALLRFNALELGVGERTKLERMLRSNSRERFEKFVEILFQLHLQFSSSQLGRGERIAVLFDRIADTMLQSGDFGQLERLVCKLRTLSQEDGEDFSVNQVSIDYILEHWSQENFVEQILGPVLAGRTDLIQSAVGVLSNLNESAVPAICRFGVEVSDPRIRDQLWKMVARNLQGYEIQVGRYLISASIPVARELVSLLSQNGEPSQAAKSLLNGLRNPETAARLEVLSAAEKMSTEHTLTLLLRSLSDSDSAVRGKALHLLARRALPSVVSGVREVIEDHRFNEFSLDEKRRFCVTFGLVGGDLSHWIKLLKTRSLLESDQSIELKHCALVTLAVTIHPECLVLSERYKPKKKSPLLAEAAQWAQQHINCSREERTRQLYAIFYSGKLIETRMEKES